MKRCPQLRDLSNDHHPALSLALRAKKTAANPEADVAALWREIAERFPTEMEPHFRIEEEALLPALERAGEKEVVQHTLAQHEAIRHCLAGAHDREALARFAQLLDDHVRFEERMLFEIAQDCLGADDLEVVRRASAKEAS
ncbi:MAG: hemerythrin domain-containing protein [Pseudomonadota bacterium]|jgi:hemerythrin-like domain-containing protein